MWRFFIRYAASCLRRHSVGEETVYETAETYDRHLNLYGCFEDCGYICC